MAESFTIVLLGGPADGLEVEVPGAILMAGFYYHPIPPGRPSLTEPDAIAPGRQSATYRSDGTVTEDGRRRFHFQGGPR